MIFLILGCIGSLKSTYIQLFEMWFDIRHVLNGQSGIEWVSRHFRSKRVFLFDRELLDWLRICWHFCLMIVLLYRFSTSRMKPQKNHFRKWSFVFSWDQAQPTFQNRIFCFFPINRNNFVVFVSPFLSNDFKEISLSCYIILRCSTGHKLVDS